MSKIDNSLLLQAGIELMWHNGKPLTKIENTGKQMLYTLQNSETVRIRTCNDHILVVLADSPDKSARLNIEGTDWLLIVMPEIERTPGNIIAYFVPTSVAVEAACSTHQEWLASKPNTKGNNTTWNIWFDKEPWVFSAKWKQYLLKNQDVSDKFASPGTVQHEVEVARGRISKIAGVPASAISIAINY